MENYKKVCGNKEKVWFEIQPNEGEQFLSWAKELGCVWTNGQEIIPKQGVAFLHLSIRSDGTLAYVDMITWFSKHSTTKNVEKYVFSEYIKGFRVKPKSYIVNLQ